MDSQQHHHHDAPAFCRFGLSPVQAVCGANGTGWLPQRFESCAVQLHAQGIGLGRYIKPFALIITPLPDLRSDYAPRIAHPGPSPGKPMGWFAPPSHPFQSPPPHPTSPFLPVLAPPLSDLHLRFFRFLVEVGLGRRSQSHVLRRDVEATNAHVLSCTVRESSSTVASSTASSPSQL